MKTINGLTKNEIIGLIEAHGVKATEAGTKNNFKGDQVAFKKHIAMIGKYEGWLKELEA